MKNFTPALVNTGKQKFSFKTLFFGNALAKSSYYSAKHKTEDIYLLWIESSRFGTTLCFPCVLEEQGDPMVYLTGKGHMMKNNAMIQRWGLFAKPSAFAQEFDVNELTPDEFHAEYSEFKMKAAGNAEADALSDSEGTEAEDSAEEQPANTEATEQPEDSETPEE